MSLWLLDRIGLLLIELLPPGIILDLSYLLTFYRLTAAVIRVSSTRPIAEKAG